MIITIYGEDAYRAKEKKTELIEKFKEKFDKSGMNVSIFQDIKNEAEIANAIGALPFLSPRRMVVISGLAESITRKADAKMWADRTKNLGDETIVILIDNIETAKAPKNKLYQAIKEDQTVHEYAFPQMSQSQVSSWAQLQIQKTGTKWSNQAIQELVNRQSADTWQMKQDIDKISAAAPEKNVEIELVKQMSSPKFSDVLFAFLDAVRTKNTKQAVELMNSELKRGTPPYKLLMMLEREVQMIAELRAFALANGRNCEREAARELRIHPFVVKKTIPRAINISDAQIKNMIEAVIAAEFRIKRESADETEVVTQLVIDLLK